MAQILHVDSSYSGENSASRSLSHTFVAAWQAFHPESTILYRDLARDPVPYITPAWIMATRLDRARHTAEMKAALQLSDPILQEFVTVDKYVFGVPMYGFTIPAILKAYIEHLIREGETYDVNEQGIQGLLKGKKALFITSRGGNYQRDSPLFSYDFQEPYLRTIFGSFGITDVDFIHASDLILGDRDESLNAALSTIKSKAMEW